ncbi:MAG: hypothetical protein A3G33_00280 [Omnitrophica bacterium RIFCSPLOWO2_12_FULL_44_17]|uniref:DUF4268 domain-containing protein n=1 Tax=Candidatus Danuiimicrobium aquiferis TaxID=1801832 RepID=A0A1G1L391_9BACT|nr:MAG: hypothetical protein A3E74_06725 [Omnitrophica bacterium RIFCSPHIGHO2_12_FULL_44_12]OGW99602.1 MAG: hypothetical protein A3G33_00280 [Omnitrophica bacterium RIFCSPLOWO2_12_FULL_44_17]OGX04679.1 MAG: hypothetical protein A3J12_06680 [Omnitrophica bacterium RIFCSPLOWO2_02_FULL_44_11]
MIKTLGKLKKVDLRTIWEHEALSFTKWLAKEDNLAALSEELGISIKLLKTEADVGGFNVDILAEEEDSERKIIIENQLEVTDHDHLGKLLTYASGVDASVIIWIFKEIREEHRRAIDWLNEHTDDSIDFFAVKMELWQISESLPAPKFQIISNPNNWAKVVKTKTEESRLTDTKLYQLDLWNNFKTYASDHQIKLNLTKTGPQHWYSFSVGSSICHLALTVNTRSKELGCELYISDDKELFDFLFSKKNEIEKDLNLKLEWMRLPDDTKASRIKTAKKFEIIGSKNFAKYQEAFEWMQSNLENFKKTFSKYLSAYQ